MKLFQISVTIILSSLLLSSHLKSEVFLVSSQEEFKDAHNSASQSDSIVWKSGTYSGVRMDIEKNDLTIMAEQLGSAIFTGVSRVNIYGDSIVFQGFQYLNGNLGPQDIINITGSHITVTQININQYTCNKYLRVREESQYVDITYCNFENRLNLIDQNILSILVNETNPGYHKIQYCSFKNFDGIGLDQGIEPIRIGVSTQGEFISRTLVEYCYFTQCNGDGEIISSKARQNIYRYNTFENNPVSELVLRHGSESIVYGNFFLNGKGGVRVREGQNHYIYNNYFHQLDDRPIYLQNDPSDPLDNINIAFNTIVGCAEARLGGAGNNPPANVTFSNNIFTDPDGNLFRDATGTETWIGNICLGNLGTTLPASGMTIVDPALEQNNEGYYGLSQSSPAINAAQPGYDLLPEYMGIENIDTEVLFDLMAQMRPASIEEKDVGCSEHPHTVPISPIATEDNTGPDYDTSSTLSVQNTARTVEDLIIINPNPVLNQLNIEITDKVRGDIRIDIIDADGRIVDTISKKINSPGKLILSRNIESITSGLYTVRASNYNQIDKLARVQSIKLLKLP